MLSTKRIQETTSAGRSSAGPEKAEPVQSRPALVPTLISTELVVNGALASSGEIQIDGRVEGDVSCPALIIGETGSVCGSISANTVEIRGRVQGEIRASKIQLGATCRVEADLLHETLVVANGAMFEGTCRRSENSNAKDAGKDAPRVRALAAGA